MNARRLFGERLARDKEELFRENGEIAALRRCAFPDRLTSRERRARGHS
jgi:hypothetical protein